MKNFNIQVRVRFKEGILDPQAEVILKALQNLDFRSIQSVECEKIFQLRLEAENEGQAIEIGRQSAQKLLANLVMEDFDVEVRA